MHTLRETAIRNVASGENVVIYQPANLYDCTLGDNVFVGPFVEIQGHTRIGNDSKIQSHTFICEYVTIGERCFIGHGVMFANDMFREGKPNADRELGKNCDWQRCVYRQRRNHSGGQHLRWGRDWRGQRGDQIHYRERRVGREPGKACCGGYNKNAGHMGRHCERFSDYARQDL
jgi:NDP-sugar pyrophosphorylase family protein